MKEGVCADEDGGTMLVGISLCANSWISRMDSVRKVDMSCESLQDLAMATDA